MTALLLVALLACTDKATDDSGSTDPTDGGATEHSGTDGGTATAGPWADHALMEPGRFYVTAHRGGALLRPEHTMEAFANAWSLGADVLELDLHSTSDGVIVVMHDDEVDRTTDGTGVIKDMSFAELRALDAGYWFSTDEGETYPYRGAGLVVPTLEEILSAFPDALYNIELKQQDPPIIDELIAAVRAAGVDDQAMLTSFEDGQLVTIRETAPDIITALGTLESIELYYLSEDDLDGYEAPAPLFMAPLEFAGLTMDQAGVAKSQSAGVRVHAWTVNDAATMSEVIGWGADGIITDDPETLIGLVGGR